MVSLNKDLITITKKAMRAGLRSRVHLRDAGLEAPLSTKVNNAAYHAFSCIGNNLNQFAHPAVCPRHRSYARCWPRFCPFSFVYDPQVHPRVGFRRHLALPDVIRRPGSRRVDQEAQPASWRIATEKRVAAVQSSRCKKPVYHASLALATEDLPTRAQMGAACEVVLKDLGLQDHQVWLVAPRDTADSYAHVMVNRVHPEAGKAWVPTTTIARSSARCGSCSGAGIWCMSRGIMLVVRAPKAPSIPAQRVAVTPAILPARSTKRPDLRYHRLTSKS